jgi:hypothetical protein
LWSTLEENDTYCFSSVYQEVAASDGYLFARTTFTTLGPASSGRDHLAVRQVAMSFSGASKTPPFENPLGTGSGEVFSHTNAADVGGADIQPGEETGDNASSNPFTADYTPNLSGLLADLSFIESRALPKTDLIAQWQESTSSRQDLPESPSIQKVYQLCLKCYNIMLPIWQSSEENVKDTIYRDYVLLYDWGAAYAVREGQLDQLPEEASDLSTTILMFLDEIFIITNESKQR